jgi:hypothetical protein
VQNAYWTVYLNVTLPAGTYTVIDSDPATWSHNAESSNRGNTVTWCVVCKLTDIRP